MIEEKRLTPPVPQALPGNLIELHGVSIAYEDRTSPVVKGVDFELRAGESVLFLGPSGCGKSTLAMLCAGLIPGALEADVTGAVRHHPSLLKAGQIGYVFQDPDAQFCMIQVDDEVAFGLENNRIASAQMQSRVRRALQQVRLQVADARPHDQFSGGMKQKLAIACALAMDTQLLVLDEPTANLDPLATQQVFEQIAALHRQRQTMIVIEHKFDPLLPYMDRVILFDADGHVYRAGPTREVLQEEWGWLRKVGVVPEWKTEPDWLAGDTRQREVVSLPSAQPCNTPAAMAVKNANLQYGRKQVWADVSFRVPAGAFVAIVGPNGSGKSSLLQVMTGIQKLSGGEVRLFDEPLMKWKTSERVKAISFCFQNPEYQFIYERVADELANRLLTDGVPPEVEALLTEFGLAGCGQQSPFALSQGQKRRLSVASMLREVHELYLLDEPTFGQDAKTQKAIMDRLHQLHEAGKTVVMTTHDMDLVRTYATHVLVIADGGLLFSGDAKALFENQPVLAKAHLLADVQAVSDSETGISEETRTGTGVGTRHRQGGLASVLNPPWQLVMTLCMVCVAMFARTLPQTSAMFALTVVLLLAVGRLSPWRIVKRLSPFVLFYLLYIWSLTAYGKVEPQTRTFDFLWIHMSYPGFIQGVILALRMLSVVGLGILFVAVTDVTALVVGLCKNFHVPPKFAYGVLAGIRFAPLFQTEWTKLKQARQLRGKDAKWSALRPVTYALPLLTQAIRMADRVALAMEARGFRGDVTQHASARTFYRQIDVHWWDVAYAVCVVFVAVALLIAVR